MLDKFMHDGYFYQPKIRDLEPEEAVHRRHAYELLFTKNGKSRRM